jgi:anti-sigma-K factor RskA
VEGAWVWPLWPMFEDVEDVSGAVVQYRGSNTVLLLLKGLPLLPSDRTYQVWRMMKDKPESAGLIPAIAPEASRFQTVKLQTDFSVADAGSISVEPAGGSSFPSLIVLYGRYPK